MNWQIQHIENIEQWAPHWDALVNATQPVPFLESAFLIPLIREFGSGKEILAFCNKNSKTIAATILTPERLGTWKTFQPSQMPLGSWVSHPEYQVPELCAGLSKALPGLVLGINLTQQDPLLRPRPDDGPQIVTSDYVQTAWIDIDTTFDAYWESRGKNLKTNTRKQRVKLEQEGIKTSLECITAPSAIASCIANYGELESRGWKGKEGTAVHCDNAQGRFYGSMLQNFCEAGGRGRVYLYRFNEKVVAMDLCIENADRIVILKTAYDESYKTVSPSTLMRQEAFQNIFDSQKFKRIEFYGKLMEWHKRWTDNARTLYHVTWYRHPIVRQAHSTLTRYRKRSRQEIRPQGDSPETSA